MNSISNSIKPIIKWSGSKRLQASTITKIIPSFSTYYEPFIGGGSILFSTNPKKAICGDICKPLIEFWQLVQMNPKLLIKNYSDSWNMLRKQGYTYYYEVRDRFNASQNPSDLLFLSRTCVNGLIRFNRKGEFNNSLHHTRRGINPDKLASIILYWSSRLMNVEFVQGDYQETTKNANKNDFVYLDPPYFNTKGRYYGRINHEDFLQYLQTLNEKGIRFALSFDGSRGSKEYAADIPKELYKHHFLINSGNSAFKKVIDNKIELVTESLYTNYSEDEANLNNYSKITGPSNLSSSEANLVVLKSTE